VGAFADYVGTKTDFAAAVVARPVFGAGEQRETDAL